MKKEIAEILAKAIRYAIEKETEEHAAIEKAGKFDINTLKPFDKVLVRDGNSAKWAIELWMAYTPQYQKWKHQCLGSAYGQCIPYEGNEHLMLTVARPDEYYITWETNEQEEEE